MTKWLIIADSAQAEIYEFIPKDQQAENFELYDKYHPPVKLINTLIHKESLLKDSELTTDKPGGHRSSDSGSFYIYEPSSNAHEHEKNVFAKTLATHIKRQSDINCFDELILCMEPSFEGKLKNNLSKDIKNKIIGEIQKHILNLPVNKKMQRISEIYQMLCHNDKKLV